MPGIIEVTLVNLIALAASAVAGLYYYRQRDNKPLSTMMLIGPMILFLGVMLTGTGFLAWQMLR